MRKSFLKWTMVCLGLIAGTHTIMADNPETDYYWATVTIEPSTTTAGSGQVYVTAEDINIDDVTAWASSSTAEGSVESVVAVGGMSNIHFHAFAKPNWGSYLAGWSYADGGADIYGVNESEREESSKLLPLETSSKRGKVNSTHHKIYATFQPIRIVSCNRTDGDGITVDDGANWTCTQTFLFRAEAGDYYGLGNANDIAHFKNPTITKKNGTLGTWTCSTLIAEDVAGRNSYFYNSYAELYVTVTFTAPDDTPRDYAATLTLETKAGKKMNVPVVARTAPSDAGQAIRYNKDKEQQGDIVSFDQALSDAQTGDIIQLIGNYSSSDQTIAKNITLDLNGYSFSKKLTIAEGGNVTIAYSPYGGKIGNAKKITVTSGGKLTANGGLLTGQLEVQSGAEAVINGATIANAVTNNGTLTLADGELQKGVTSSGALTINGGKIENSSGAAVTVTNGTAAINRGSIYGSTYGVHANGGAATIEKLAAVSGDTYDLYRQTGTLTVNNGKFTDPSKFNGDITFHAGYFKTNTTNVTAVSSLPIWRNTAGTEYREGYVFFAGSQATAQSVNVSVCRINNTAYATLEDALAYANNNPSKTITIFMENDYTLPAGYYTIPANTTLIVPMSSEQRIAYPAVPRAIPDVNYPTPQVFRTLTFANGVNISVLGAIEVSGTQYCKNGLPYQAVPGGTYGRLILVPGSHITLNNGGELRAWGYVTGDGTKDSDDNYLSGEIDARRGSIVREQFQIGDWKGGNISLGMIMDEIPQNKTHLFPIYEYFIQNVESPIKYHPGSSLLCSTGVNVAGDLVAYADAVPVVGLLGEAAMFLMDPMADADNTWVRKWYDAKNDKQVYEINSGAQLGSMVIDLGEINKAVIQPGESGKYQILMDSRKFALPLTSNMKIHLLSGTMQFTQSTSCLPGMEVEIDKESTISIINQDRAEVVEGALYLYDSEQWNACVQGGPYGRIVNYSATLDAQPTARDVSSPAAIGDATLNVHGTFQVGANCAVYTTVGKTPSFLAEDTYHFAPNASIGGANIISTNADAGTFIFSAQAPTATGVTIYNGYPVLNDQGEVNPEVLVHYDPSDAGMVVTLPKGPAHIYGFELCVSALLKNGDQTLTPTEGTLAGKSFCYMNGAWTDMTVDEDDECFMVDGTDTYYAKPADYVALANGKTENADHTYTSAVGNRTFILTNEESCQWWEVEKKDNLYHCIHPNNDTYYYWNGYKWVEKKFTITWRNWDGTIIPTIDENGDPVDNYDVTYGTMAEFFGSNPTRVANIDYTYDFTGWTPALGPVKSDVTYTATYVEQPRKYTIVFQDEGGTEIERQFLTHNEMPVCENIPTRTGFVLDWTPAIKAVTGDATYSATWLEEPPTEYAITFFDYDGTTKLKPTDETPYMVAVGAMPVAPAEPANKPEKPEFTYVFDHWSPAIEEVSLTSAKSYTAVYREVAKTYTIYYFMEDGTTPNPIKPSEELAYGATPTPPAVTKENPAANYTYTLEWRTLDESGGIQTVMGDAYYKPTYQAEENRYTRYSVTLSTNIAAGCTLIGAGTYDEGTDVTIQAIVADGYEFVEWEQTHNTNADLGAQTINADVTLTAIVQPEAITPTDLEIAADGSETLVAPVTKHDLVITSNGVTSGQLIGANYLTLTGDAFFDITPAGGFVARTWYTVAAPWPVDATSGIYSGTSPLTLGSSIEVYYYDGATRATNGKGGNWLYLKNAGDKTMQPGTLYMIYLANDVATLRFQKKSGAGLLTTTLSVEAHPQTTGNEADAGWNGIANPALYHAYVNPMANTYSHANFGQKYVPFEERYEATNMADNPLIVGEPIFVQVAADKSDVTAVTSNPFSAPARRAIVHNAYYEVQIAAEENCTDRIYLQTMEDKEDRYVIELDLAKAGISSKVAQMWVDRYNTKLCVNTTAPVGRTATYPLGIFIPKSGSYTISSATEMQEGQELYVTRNDKPIWNLAYGPYTIALNAGTYTEYGLKLIQSAPTDIDPVTDTPLTVTKVIIDNHVYILRDGELYTITGQKVQ